jgi:hypothetical protein
VLAHAAEREAGPAQQSVPNDAFRSARAPDAPALVWAVGDGADGSAASRRLAARIARSRPARLLYLGDVYERGTPAEFRRNFAPVYGRLARITAPTPGNHDWPRHGQGYDPYWRSVTGAPTPPWYAFRTGGWTVVSLNSEAPHGEGSRQLAWLRARLSRVRGTCVLAFWHRPRWSAGRYGDQPDVAPLWKALRGRAPLVLSGHDHNLQRFRPLDGIVQYVAGAGGRGRYAVEASDPRPVFARDDRDGALRIRLRPGLARLSFVTAGGRVLDRSTVRCRPAGA